MCPPQVWGAEGERGLPRGCSLRHHQQVLRPQLRDVLRFLLYMMSVHTYNYTYCISIVHTFFFYCTTNEKAFIYIYLAYIHTVYSSVGSLLAVRRFRVFLGEWDKHVSIWFLVNVYWKYVSMVLNTKYIYTIT